MMMMEMKLKGTLILLIFSTALHAKNISPYKIKSEIRKVSLKDLRASLRSFVHCCSPNRVAGSKGGKEARKYIEKRIQQLDPWNKGNLSKYLFTPDLEYAKRIYQNDFDKKIKAKFPSHSAQYKKWARFTISSQKAVQSFAGIKGENIIWEMKGSKEPQKILILGAHYDTLAHNKEKMSVIMDGPMPGADDNGTGVNFLLNFIPSLIEFGSHYTVRVVFFDFQEIGNLGSRDYVLKLTKELEEDKSKEIIGFINFEMLGFDGKTLDKEKKWGNYRVYGRSVRDPGGKADKKLFNEIFEKGRDFSSRMKFEFMATGDESSDQVSFWEANIPAILMSENRETDFNLKGHHSENDVVETLNMRTYHHVYLYLSGSLLSYLNDL
jgi:Zn-dependent M28 family amino/carboxypeptidase